MSLSKLLLPLFCVRFFFFFLFFFILLILWFVLLTQYLHAARDWVDFCLAIHTVPGRM